MESSEGKGYSNKANNKVALILQKILEIIDEESTFIWSGYEDYEAAKGELESLIDRLKLKDQKAIEEVYGLFLPTGVFQELSIDNGWPDYYMKLSEQFDSIYYKSKNSIELDHYPLPKRRIWQKIFGLFKKK